MCDGRYKAKEQCQCISVLIPLTGWLSKKKWIQHEGYIGIIIAYCPVYPTWGTWNKTRKIRFSVKVDF